MSDIIIVGSLNMDLVIHAPRIPAMGETLIGDGFMTVPGGKGANQAVAASRLGGNVSMIGCVGRDVFGQSLVACLERDQVDTTYISEIKDMPSGVAMITIQDGDNCIIIDPGANYALIPEYIDSLEDVFTQVSIVVVQLEIPMETVETVVAAAHGKGARVLLNPAPAASLPETLLSGVDILVPNQTECGLITGMEVNTIDDAKAAVEWLAGLDIPQVIVTMGDRGVVYNHGREIIHREAAKVDAVDTTAAGDSFIGAVAVALSQGKGIDEAVAFGNAVGALTVTKKGAQSSLPTLDEVRAYRQREQE